MKTKFYVNQPVCEGLSFAVFHRKLPLPLACCAPLRPTSSQLASKFVINNILKIFAEFQPKISRKFFLPNKNPASRLNLGPKLLLAGVLSHTKIDSGVNSKKPLMDFNEAVV